jgi:pyruvate-formate lyase-activating enzyme
VGKTDEEVVTLVQQLQAKDPHISRHQLQLQAHVDHYRLLRLHKEGLIKIPPPMSKKIMATLGRKKRNLGAEFKYSKKLPPWERKEEK